MSQLQASYLADLLAVAEATPEAEFAAFEVAAALTLTRQAATMQLALAADIVRRLPEVHAAMCRGDLDLAKARVFSDVLSTLEGPVARRVVASILPVAPSLTTGQLRARLEKLVIEHDPDGAARRHRVRVAGRRVVLEPSGDSCATLLGVDLPADAAVAAAHRLTAIAAAAKQAGDQRSLDQLRADTFLDLLLGTSSATRGGVELVCDLETLAALANHPGHLNGYGPVIADIARQVAEQQRHSPWTFTVHDPSGPVHTGATRRRPTTKPPHRDPADSPTSARPTTGSLKRPHSTPTNPGQSHPASAGQSRSASAGLAGPSRSASDSGGQSRSAAAGSGTSLAAEPSAGHRVAAHAANGGGFGDPRSRFPNAALARHVRARDRTCRAPGCRRPASRADLDHTIPYEHGGLTVPGNLGALCRFHHRARHKGRWVLCQIRPGVFVWLSPLGRRYTTRPEGP